MIVKELGRQLWPVYPEKPDGPKFEAYVFEIEGTDHKHIIDAADADKNCGAEWCREMNEQWLRWIKEEKGS